MSWLILPSCPTGDRRRIELAGLDLSIIPRIDNIFVYPAALGIDRFKDALSRTISLCPLVAGRFLAFNGSDYAIEMSDNGIPLTYTEDTELAKWPLNDNVVVDISQNTLAPFIDGVQTINLLTNPAEEPLVRLKITRIVQSDEWILGTSWAHILGDAESNLVFLRTISHLYQQMEPVKPLPIFYRRLWQQEEADQSLSPIMKELINAKPFEDVLKSFYSTDSTDEQVNLHFSGKHLLTLRELAGGDNITIQDALTSYLIIVLNTRCFKHDAERRILQTETAINFRGVSEAIASIGLISNAVLVLSSENFDNPFSLKSIAQTIRRSIIRSRDSEFLTRCIATADELWRKNVRENRLLNLGPFPHSMTVNSNYRYDWAALVDFGYTDKCRFHTLWTTRFYCRVFRLNPIKNGDEWLPRDHHGAEVAFRITKDIKDQFMFTLQKDMAENFSNIEL